MPPHKFLVAVALVLFIGLAIFAFFVPHPSVVHMLGVFAIAFACLCLCSLVDVWVAPGTPTRVVG